jgi:phosphoadenosine phosphosulfate reductase
MKEHVASALNLLRVVREETDSIGVAVSFGKDSLAVLDLCSQVFDRIEGYYLFRVREMEIVKRWQEDVYRRWKVYVRMYPHFDLCRCYRHGVLSPHWKPDCPKIKLTDIETAFRNDAKIEWLAMGWRRNDSFSRAIIMKQNAGYDPKSRRVFPLRAWRRQDVYDYLKVKKIPLPPSFGRKEQGGLDFNIGALSYLRDNHPDDYARWLRDFPFSEVQLKKETACP